MEADWTPELKKGPAKNLPRSWPPRRVTTPQHARCLRGHGDRSSRAGEGLEEVRGGRREPLGQAEEGKCAIFFRFSDSNVIMESFSV